MENEKVEPMEIVQTAKRNVIALDPKVMERQLSAETKRRELITEYIQKNLIADTDYGKIPLGGGRESKNTLFKSGAEKFCSLLQLRATFRPDDDILRMVGGTGLIALVCELVHIPSGQIVSEGRGACHLNEKKNVANTTIKIAEKRAKIDAVLALGLSDTFTQDMEDIKQQEDVAQVSYGQTYNTPVKELPVVSSVEPEKPKKLHALELIKKIKTIRDVKTLEQLHAKILEGTVYSDMEKRTVEGALLTQIDEVSKSNSDEKEPF